MAILVGTLARRSGWLVLLAPLMLQACAEKAAAPAGSHNRIFHADMTGAAKQCTASKPALQDGQETTATLQVGNDGGWCAIAVSRGGDPYAAGLLITPAAHGRVFIHPVGDDTRIDYTPATGYAGPDAFAVRLIPGNPVIRVSVTVSR